MISLQSIEKSYHLSNQTVKVLNNINLALYPGELSYLLGESGCGKSTLLNILGGIDKADNGEYIFDGKNVTNFKEKDWAYFRRNKIGFVFQTFNLIPHLIALENIEMSMILDGFSKTDRRARALELLELVGLKDRASHLPNQLSGGQKQRVAIARSLANNPDIILADEPTGALDSENSEQIMKILKEVSQQGKIVLVVTHSQELLHFADKVIKMKDGTINEVKQITVKNDSPIQKEKMNSNKPKKLNWGTTVKLSLRNLKNKKWRNTLTAIGASIGILGIVLIGALGNGINEKIKNSLDLKTANSSIGVYKKGTELLSPKVAEEIKKVKDVKAVYTYNPFSISIESKNEKKETVSADTLVPPKYKKIYGNSYITNGRYPTKNHELVLPERTAQKLFGNNLKKAIGKKIKIVSQLMAMKGIYQTVQTEATVTGTVANSAIPITDSAGFSYPLAMEVTNENPETQNKALQYTVIPSSIDKVDSIINKLKTKGYIAETEEDSNKEISNYVTMASVAIGLLSAISLVVSSIMIGIVLYVSVLERTREIGTLKALGAFKSDIRRIFVTEGFMIGALGGIFGVIGSMILGKLANFIIKEGFNKPTLQLFQFEAYQLIIIIIFSGLLGVLASFIPAFRASKLNPVEALKYE